MQDKAFLFTNRKSSVMQTILPIQFFTRMQPLHCCKASIYSLSSGE